MNKFSKITGIISFWSNLIVFLGTVLIIVFQRQILKIFSLDPAVLNCFIFPVKEFFLSLLLLLLVAVFCFHTKTNNKNRAILSLYFYLLVTILFSNPLISYISNMINSVMGHIYLSASSYMSNALQLFLYIFTLVSTICFYLSAGSLIVLGDTENKETSAELSNKQKRNLVLFSGFLGAFGVDRFYAGKIVSGIIKLIFFPLTIVLARFILPSVYGYIAGSVISTFACAGILFLPVLVFNIVDFILCVLGKFKDSEKKLIANW